MSPRPNKAVMVPAVPAGSAGVEEQTGAGSPPRQEPGKDQERAEAEEAALCAPPSGGPSVV